MPDAIFDHPRLAAVYDGLDGDRSDLDGYAHIVVDELGACSVLDIGCGTGTFAVLLAERGIEMVGIDPASASVSVARGKPAARTVRWIVGTVDALPELEVDAVVMTANVAQVFLDDEAWLEALTAARNALRPGGMLVFEARRPEARAWEGWTKEATRQVITIPGVGVVEDWKQVTNINGDFVTFDSPTTFHADGVRIDSTSTLRFRTREEIENSIVQAGLEVVDVRDLGYAPGRSWLYIARRANSHGIDPGRR